MAQANFTPISLYYSATPTNVPSAGNLVAGELALNTADGKLFFKNSSNIVTVLATAANATSPLAIANGGTGATTLAAAFIPTYTSTNTFTNKRVDPRVSSAASTATLTPDISAYDQNVLTAQAVGLTINAPTGTPVDGNKLIIRILDNGTSQTLTWDATYTVIGVTLPVATTISKILYVGCIYNTANTRWDVVAVATQT